MDDDYEFVDDDQSISEYAISSRLKYVLSNHYQSLWPGKPKF